MTLPAPSMRPAPASAFVPSSVTTWPLTRTWPLTISCSAWRREAMPARAIIFCRRSCIFVGQVFLPVRFEYENGVCRVPAMPLADSQKWLSHKSLSFSGGSGLVRLLVAGAPIPLWNRIRVGCGILRDDPLFWGVAVGESCSAGGRVQHAFVAGLAWRDAFVAAQGFASEGLQLLEAGQLVEIAQAEAHQKFFRCFVQNLPADDFFAARGGDQALVEQRFQHAGRVHAADFADFRRRDRLLVGDDRERFERGHGKAQRRTQALDEAAHYVVMLRLGIHLVAAGDAAHFDAAFIGRVAGHQFVERGLHYELFLVERGGELLYRGRLVRRVDDRFQCCFAFFVGHLSTAPAKLVILRLSDEDSRRISALAATEAFRHLRSFATQKALRSG